MKTVTWGGATLLFLSFSSGVYVSCPHLYTSSPRKGLLNSSGPPRMTLNFSSPLPQVLANISLCVAGAQTQGVAHARQA